MDPYFDPYTKLESDESGRLPHWEQEEKMQFVTMRLGDSIPQAKLNTFREEKQKWLEMHPRPWSKHEENEYHDKFSKSVDYWLDKGLGSCILKHPAAAEVIEKILLRGDTKKWDVHGYVIMPNHLHLIITPLNGQKLKHIIEDIKNQSAKNIKELFDITGNVWEQEYFDRIVRNERHYKNLKIYIWNNWNICKGKAKLYYSQRF